VQFSVTIEDTVFDMPFTKDGVGTFFRRYGEVRIEVAVGGSQALVTFQCAHQARAAQEALDRLSLAGGLGVLRVRFWGLADLPGPNRVYDASSSCTEGLSSSAQADDVPVGHCKSATVDGVEPLELAVPQPPPRPRNGKGKSQKEFSSSLVASSADSERHEEPVELLGGEAVRIIEELREVVYGLRGLSKSERRRLVAALRPALERVEEMASDSLIPPAAAAAYAEIQLALM
jgi:hypothetical protein